MISNMRRTDLFPTPIWSTDLQEFEPSLDQMIATALAHLEAAPADEKELFEQSQASLQETTDPAWVEFFRLLARCMEEIIESALPLQCSYERLFLRSWVLRVSGHEAFRRTGPTLNTLHSHVPAILSSILYLQVPQSSVNSPSGGTMFRDPNSVYNRALGHGDFHISPAPLRLIIFPAYLEHCPSEPAPEVGFEKPRVVVATDLRMHQS